MATAGEPDRSDRPQQPDEPLSEEALKCLLEEVDRLQLDYVRFTFADMHGIARCKSVPRRHIEHFARTGGVTVYAG